MPQVGSMVSELIRLHSKCFMCIFQGECVPSCLLLLEALGPPLPFYTRWLSVSPTASLISSWGPCPSASTCTLPEVFPGLQSPVTKVPGNQCPHKQPPTSDNGGGCTNALAHSGAQAPHHSPAPRRELSSSHHKG